MAIDVSGPGPWKLNQGCCVFAARRGQPLPVELLHSLPRAVQELRRRKGSFLGIRERGSSTPPTGCGNGKGRHRILEAAADGPGARHGLPWRLEEAICSKSPPRSGQAEIVDLARAIALLRGAGGLRAGVDRHTDSTLTVNAVTVGVFQGALRDVGTARNVNCFPVP